LDLDSPELTLVRLQIIRSKPFLKAIYDEWYEMLNNSLPGMEGHVLELGSGAGFLKDVIPNVITSEVFFSPNVDLIADGCRLPIPESSLRAIVMTDVLHHIPAVELFFHEAVRCLRPGGRILMIEPWVTSWSKLIYQNLHHEPFLPDSKDWGFPSSGPLSGANGAIPWILFVRDRKKFEQTYPQLTIESVHPFMPFRYLLSGGVSTRNLIPGMSAQWIKKFESLFDANHWGMFAFVSLRLNKDVGPR